MDATDEGLAVISELAVIGLILAGLEVSPGTGGTGTTSGGAAEVEPGHPAVEAPSLTPALPESMRNDLRHLFKYQVVAAVYRGGRRYVVADPRILDEGFAYRRVIEPRRVDATAISSPIPWSEVDSLQLRRTLATPLGAGAAVGLGMVAGMVGAGLVEMGGGNGLLGALYFGVPAAVIGFAGGGFLGGWVHYWTRVYPLPEQRPGPPPGVMPERR